MKQFHELQCIFICIIFVTMLYLTWLKHCIDQSAFIFVKCTMLYAMNRAYKLSITDIETENLQSECLSLSQSEFSQTKLDCHIMQYHIRITLETIQM